MKKGFRSHCEERSDEAYPRTGGQSDLFTHFRMSDCPPSRVRPICGSKGQTSAKNALQWQPNSSFSNLLVMAVDY